MRTLISCLLITILSFGLLVNEAAAKRFGGGRSFGVQRSQSSMYSPNKVQKTTPLGQRANNTSKWGGLLGGLLIGGLLTSLFMGHGFGTGIMTWLIVGAIIFFAVNFFRRRMQPGMQTGQQNRAFNQQQSPFNNFTQAFNNSGANSSGAADVPAGFSPANFLREAKVSFNRLQAAYDEKNTQDLREFTAPEVFAEIKMQLDERGNEPNKTEVINLEAELLDISRQTNSYIASVHFTGSIKENDEPMTQLDEIWHFRQFDGNSAWVVGGIQQNEFQS
ncbi:Tim44 domain-containing protein [Legionella lytica]|uniref:Tim44 domain-containing protein n=1 Tax=Legionella lytica TaxID=96232 RepID=A0ABW8D9Y9_9GAMM